MAKSLKVFTNISIIIAIFSNLFIAKASAFSDIKNQFAKECISQLAERKLIKGYADQTFRPQSTISRAEFAVLLLNAFPN
ncbi:S-layer homology domain-containing protein [Tolypothrix sp. FACHB-123]|jgi:dTDP-4-dehydrorhamnose reductase|uniref:S-layer homology domain-containing protein n=1 Tax=Tolypothrix sp. FACHB-123 TaxID=2692868 RepID=UPI00168897A5|nr:S-layer homology domain-containing protein [Tolypothrix sp. FACHB-123]MBD2359497.1 S-layer homology domain-containing protein [Tolypothrix sp. FACHB-123]